MKPRFELIQGVDDVSKVDYYFAEILDIMEGYIEDDELYCNEMEVAYNELLKAKWFWEHYWSDL